MVRKAKSKRQVDKAPSESGAAGYSIASDLLEIDTGHILARLHNRFSRRALGHDSGRNRNVFIFKRFVVKLPRNTYGLMDNSWEARQHNSADANDALSNVQYPKTRLIQIDGFPILYMERIEPVDFSVTRYKDLPDWVSYIDCGQVGYTKRGRLVAFDYGRH